MPGVWPAWKTSGSRGWTPASAERLLRLHVRKPPRQRHISEPADEKVTRATTPPHGCAGSGAASGQDSGGRRHPVTESGGASTAAGSVYRLVKAAFRWLQAGAPAGFEPALTAPEGLLCMPLTCEKVLQHRWSGHASDTTRQAETTGAQTGEVPVSVEASALTSLCGQPPGSAR
jgi:hypothetical protein